MVESSNVGFASNGIRDIPIIIYPGRIIKRLIKKDKNGVEYYRLSIPKEWFYKMLHCSPDCATAGILQYMEEPKEEERFF